MSKKVLIITGLTATGKTGLAVELCKKIGGEIISADSRQVYKYMDIGTGKDIGRAKFNLRKRIGCKDIGFYRIDGIPVWLLDVLEPSRQFDLAEFIKLSKLVMKDICSRGKKVIMVGGTGYYISALLKPPETIGVKPNKILRSLLKRMPTSFIIKIYKMLDSHNYQRLNKSEKNNKHRLIRKIEIKLSLKDLKRNDEFDHDSKVICLWTDKDIISENIKNRVSKRLQQGLLAEVELLKNKYGFEAPGLNCLAYKEFRDYFEKKESLKNCIDKWIKDEINYAKRQRTWFKAKNYDFVNVDKFDKKELLENLNRWYNEA